MLTRKIMGMLFAVAAATIMHDPACADDLPFPSQPGVYEGSDYYIVESGDSPTAAGGEYYFSGSGSQLWVKDGGTLTVANSASISMDDWFFIDNYGTINIDGDLITTESAGSFIGMVQTTIFNRDTGVINFGADSTYTDLAIDGYNHFVNVSGVINIGATDEDSVRAILANTSLLAGGIVNLYSQVDGFSLADNIGSRDYDGTVVLQNDSHTFTAMVDVRESRLDTSEVGGAFYGDVVSSRKNERQGAIKTGKITDFYGDVYGYLQVVDGITTFKDGSSYNVGSDYFNGTHHLNDEAFLDVDAGATLINETDLALKSDCTMWIRNSGTIINDKTITVGQPTPNLNKQNVILNNAGATFINNGTVTFVDNRPVFLSNDGTFENNGTLDFGLETATYEGTGTIDNTGVIHASTKTRGLTDLFAATDLSASDSVFNLNYVSGSGNNTVLQLEIGDSTAGSKINLIVDPSYQHDNIVLTDLDAKNSDISVTGGSVLQWGHGIISTTGDFTLDAGTTLNNRYSSSSTSLTGGTINAGNVNFNGAVEVGSSSILTINADEVIFGADSSYAPGFSGGSSKGYIIVDGDVAVTNGARLILNQGLASSQLEDVPLLVASGTIDGSFANDRYNFTVKNVNGEDVVMLDDGKPVNTVEEIYENVTGGENLSGSASQGAGYIDEFLENLQVSGDYKSSLDTFIQNMSQYDVNILERELRLLSGNSGVYARAPMKIAATRFLTALGDKLNPTGIEPTIACGGMNGIWASGFGSWDKLRNKSGYAGYSYDAYGFMLGYERNFGNWILGVAGAYSDGDLDTHDDLGEIDAQTMNLGVYGKYTDDNGFYAKGVLAFSYGWNDTKASSAVFGSKKGSYDTQAYSASLEVGKIFPLASCFNFIPSAGVRYTHVRQDGWEESVGGSAIRNWYARQHDDVVEIPVFARLNRVFAVDNVIVTPELRAGWVYSATNPRESIRSGLVGSSIGETTYGARVGRSRLSLGAGVKARFADRIDTTVDYAFETRGRNHNHNVNAKIGINF